MFNRDATQGEPSAVSMEEDSRASTDHWAWSVEVDHRDVVVLSTHAGQMF